ncbi:MAG: M23 family metallopeptidase [Candidatus Sphingomonas colombiensis]|nr:M23 family metallopeptidase [Sphingomonas sp.]WEK41685.1 MAG: M23 family metallopeptidase [Sphingomonas sp.]
MPHNTPVRATADGTVAYAGDAIAALGGLVIVKHGEGWTSVYGHASKLLVQRGQAVKKGQTVALSGARLATPTGPRCISSCAKVAGRRSTR